MGLMRDLATALGRAALETLSKADSPRPPPEDDEEEDTEDEAESDTEDDAGGQGPGEGATTPLPAALREKGGKDGQDAPEGPQEPKSVIPRTPAELDEAKRDPKSMFWDPYAIVNSLGYKDRPSPLTYQTLRAMVWQTPVLQAIIRQRLRQITNFSMPQVDKYGTGFRVALRDKKAKPTPASEARSQQLEQWLLTTGTTDNPDTRDSFSTFLQKFLADSLIFDQATMEIVPARNGKPAAFHAVDASTIRIADSSKLYLPDSDRKAARWAQIYDGMIVNEYTADELTFGVRNPSANIQLQGYGQSEVEMLITTVTSLLWAWDYNQKAFSQGSNIKGLINFKGPVPKRELNAFRQHWYAMTAGVTNAFKTPIVNADDMQWISMQQSNRDMEYNAWFDFLIKIAAGIYGMDPMEINFKYGDTGAKAMFESNNQGKLTASKDKGLKPLLLFAAGQINQGLIHKLDEDFCFEFVGLDASTPAEQADLITKQVKSFKTVDEARAEEDMPPLPNGMGAIILDPVYMQHLGMTQQAQNPEPPPGEGGDFNFDREDGKTDGGQAPEGAPEGEAADMPGLGQKPKNPFAKSQKRRGVVLELKL